MRRWFNEHELCKFEIIDNWSSLNALERTYADDVVCGSDDDGMKLHQKFPHTSMEQKMSAATT